MKLYKYELEKIWQARFPAILFAVFAALSLVLSYVIANRAPNFERAKAAGYEAYMEDPEGVEAYRQYMQETGIAAMRLGRDPEYPYTYDESGAVNDNAVLHNLQSRLEYLGGGYDTSIRRIIATAERQAEDLVSFGYAPDGYEVRANRALVERYESLGDAVTLETGYAMGYDTYLTNPVLPWLILLYVTLSASFIFRSDFASGAYSIMRASRRGGLPTALAKLGAVMTVTVLSAVTFSALAFAAAGYARGLSSPYMPIQAFPDFYAVPWRVTILEYLFLHLGVRVLAAALYGAFLSLIASLQTSYIGCFGAGALLYGANFFLFARNYSGTVPSIRYLNLAGGMDATALTSFYRTVSVLGRPVSHVTVWICAAALLLLLFSGAAAYFFSRNIRLVVRRFRRPFFRLPARAMRRTVTRTRVLCGGLGGAEARKSRLILTVLAALLLLAGRVYTVRSGIGNMKQYREAIYYQYILSLQEAEDPFVWLDTEEARLEAIIGKKAQMEKDFENGVIDRTTYIRYQSDADTAEAQRSVFQSVKDYVNYIAAKNMTTGLEGRIIYTSGYDKLFSLASDGFFAAAAILLCARVFSVEYEARGANAGFSQILRTTRNGRKKTYAVKLRLFMLCGGAVAVLFRLATVLTVRDAYILPDADALLYSVSVFPQVTAGITIWQYLVLDGIAQAVGGALLCGILCALSYAVKTTLPYLGAAMTVVLIPEITVRTALTMLPYLSPISFTAPHNYVQKLGFGSPAACVALVLAVFALVSAAVIWAARRSYCGGKIIGRKKRNG